MARIAVRGTSGSGKSTLARRIAERTGVPWVQLDAIFHQPGWTQLPLDRYRERVGEAVAGDGWVIDGNYEAMVGDLVLARAQLVVWLDLPRPVVTRRIVARTLRRAITREELWNGNRERWRNLFSLDPERSVIAWSWTTHARNRRRAAAAAGGAAYPGPTHVRLRSRREVDRFLAGLR
jgi:adenylate kinase family enzyme